MSDRWYGWVMRLTSAALVAAMIAAAWSCRAASNSTPSTSQPTYSLPKIEAGTVAADAAGLSAGTAFLSAADFTPPASPTQLTPDELAAAINGDQTFFNNAPTYDPPTDPCIVDLQTKLLPKIAMGLLIFDLPLTDLTACEASRSNAAHRYTSYKTRLHLEVQCPGKDFKSFQQISYANLAAAIDPACGTTGGLLYNSLTKFTYINTGNASGSVASGSGTQAPGSYTQTTKVGVFSKGGEACPTAQLASRLVTDDCVHVTLSETEGGQATTTHYSQKVLHQAAATPHDTYFASGSISFTIDNWSGTAAYAQAQMPPRWQAHSAQASASGTFTYAPKTGSD